MKATIPIIIKAVVMISCIAGVRGFWGSVVDTVNNAVEGVSGVVDGVSDVILVLVDSHLVKKNRHSTKL